MLVMDHTGIEGVTKNDRYLTLRERARRSFGRWSRAQSLVVERDRQLSDAELPGRTLLERPANEWSAIWINVDRVDEPAFIVLSNVEVPEFCAADHSALLDLVRHLDCDVFTTLL